jgi:phosphonate transport system substrate-binding protein
MLRVLRNISVGIALAATALAPGWAEEAPLKTLNFGIISTESQ